MMGVGKRKSAPHIRGHITTDPHIYKNATTKYKITKMPLLGLKCWPTHLDDVEMMWT